MEKERERRGRRGDGSWKSWSLGFGLGKTWVAGTL